MALFIIIGSAYGINYEVENIITIHRNRQDFTSVTLRPDTDYSAVQIVDLDYNKLQYKDFVVLTKLPSLVKFSLWSNKIVGSFNLGILVDSKSLKLVYISKNQITELQNSKKDQRSILEVLSLRQNNLTFIEMNIFESFINLNSLDLSGNKIFRVDNQKAFGLLKSIKMLNIFKNKWICDSLKEFVSILKEGKVIYSTVLSCNGTNQYLYEGICCYEYLADLEIDLPELSYRYRFIMLELTIKTSHNEFLTEDSSNFENAIKQIQEEQNEQKKILEKMSAKYKKNNGKIVELELYQYIVNGVIVAVFAIIIILSIIILIFLCRKTTPREEEIEMESMNDQEESGEPEGIYFEIDN